MTMTLREAAARLGRSKSTLQYFYRKLPEALKEKDSAGRICVTEAAFAELTRLTRFDATVDAVHDAVDASADAVFMRSDALSDAVDAEEGENVDAVSDAVNAAQTRHNGGVDAVAHEPDTTVQHATSDIALRALGEELATLREERSAELERLRAEHAEEVTRLRSEVERLQAENDRLNGLLSSALANVTRLADQAQQLQLKQLQDASGGFGKKVSAFFARLLPGKSVE